MSRVGKMSKKAGEAIRDRVAALVAAAVSQSAPDGRTAEWVGLTLVAAGALALVIVLVGAITTNL